MDRLPAAQVHPAHPRRRWSGRLRRPATPASSRSGEEKAPLEHPRLPPAISLARTRHARPYEQEAAATAASLTQNPHGPPSVSPAELLSAFVGEAERLIREIFAQARRTTPCVVFFNEIDAIVAKRTVWPKTLFQDPPHPLGCGLNHATVLVLDNTGWWGRVGWGAAASADHSAERDGRHRQGVHNRDAGPCAGRTKHAA